MQEAGKREQEMKDQKNDIAELIRQIQRLKADLEILTKQVGEHLSAPPVPPTLGQAQRVNKQGTSNAQWHIANTNTSHKSNQPFISSV